MKKKRAFKKSGEEKSKFCSNPLGGIYFLGFVGAAIYYIQQANGFWNGVLGILKALVWPAFLVYKLLGI